MAVEINIMENGPILVKGETTVKKGGKEVTVSENYALCRCGKSKISLQYFVVEFISGISFLLFIIYMVYQSQLYY